MPPKVPRKTKARRNVTQGSIAARPYLWRRGHCAAVKRGAHAPDAFYIPEISRPESFHVPSTLQHTISAVALPKEPLMSTG